ncbi:MAG: alkaline phosphatase [Caulobacterales bacterium RIFOXYB1_FULL_67_16]|jgi:membrane protein DedA with SNARE-associated domain|nr:MAG: alkaline phosphatase [Caulobacterales bacterium RIFOXYB1_FULL_67_16]
MFDLIVQIITVTGVLGVAFLMFAENVFPPIPSELIMPLAGFAAARGDLNFALVVVAGTFGAVAGAVIWYEIGRRVGLERVRRWSERHGRWLTLTPKDVETSAALFRRYGVFAVLGGRLIPAVRTWISIPAGVADMRFGPFLIFTTLGTAVFTFALAYAGYRLESHFDRVAAWLDPITTIVIVGGVAVYVFRLITFRRLPDPQS